MTNREFMTAVLTLGETFEIPADILAHAMEALAKMDTQAESRKAKEAEKRAAAREQRLKEEESVLKTIFEGLTEEAVTAPTLIKQVGLIITPQKFAQLMRPFVADGVVVKEMIKVDGKHKATGYKFASAEAREKELETYGKEITLF